MKSKIIVSAVFVVCAVGSFAVVQWNTKRAQKELSAAWDEADGLRAELDARNAEITRLNDIMRRTDEAIKRAEDAVKAAEDAHQRSAATVRKIRKVDGDWLDSPVPDGVRGLFCGSTDGAGDATSGASGAVCAAEPSPDPHE